MPSPWVQRMLDEQVKTGRMAVQRKDDHTLADRVRADVARLTREEVIRREQQERSIHDEEVTYLARRRRGVR